VANFSNIRARKSERHRAYPAVHDVQHAARLGGASAILSAAAPRLAKGGKIVLLDAETAAKPEIFKTNLFRIVGKIRRE
jgi:hypothetical protein